jgi:hypothetical protein
VSYASSRPNDKFLAVLDMLRSPRCSGRLHWGKAGWQHAQCFDGAAEYGAAWCHFGCAALRVDPAGKFVGASDIWRWRAVDTSTGQQVADFQACCMAAGPFDVSRCTCGTRIDC